MASRGWGRAIGYTMVGDRAGIALPPASRPWAKRAGTFVALATTMHDYLTTTHPQCACPWVITRRVSSKPAFSLTMLEVLHVYGECLYLGPCQAHNLHTLTGGMVPVMIIPGYLRLYRAMRRAQYGLSH
jgi:hypothetical protein